jgi:hypothetical protein
VLAYLLLESWKQPSHAVRSGARAAGPRTALLATQCSFDDFAIAASLPIHLFIFYSLGHSLKYSQIEPGK